MKPSFLLTKIIATLGPATQSKEMIRALVEKGVRVFRINFSHGSFDEHETILHNIRETEKETGIFTAVIGDLAGPKIRIGKVIEGGINVSENQEVIFTKKEVITGKGDDKIVFSTNFPEFIDEVKTGENILLDDGNVRMECKQITGEGSNRKVICKVVTGGELSTAKGINLPDTDLSMPALTEKDLKCVEFAVKHHFDYLALSFVRKPEDLLLLKDKLRALGVLPEMTTESPGDLGFSELPENKTDFIPIIAKIEKPQAIKNLDSIVRHSDAIMVARGDLGVEMDLADVAVLQKEIIHMCHEYGKPVIVATQMLQSMINSKSPTRAEVSDVANAIFDGVDAVMLSGETAVGKYPIETVAIMNKIASRTSEYIKKNAIQSVAASSRPDISENPEAIARGVQTIAENINPLFLVIWTNRGVSAVYLSQQRMPIPILAFSSIKSRLRKLALLYGVKPIYHQTPSSGSTFIRSIDKILLNKNWAKKDDPVVVISSDPIQRKGLANRIVIHLIGETIE